jgi:hypothetical protein
MALHLVKLCVGAESVADLADWIERRLAERRRQGQPAEHVHVTRMVPKRAAEIVDGGSLYWVIRGVVQVRQRLIAVRPVIDRAGTRRCHLVLEPELVATAPQPRAPFQGWRYLKDAEAPRDLAALGKAAGLPPHLAQELRTLGLL